MKKILLIVAVVSFAAVGTTVPLHADVAKGQKLFKKKFRKACHFSGVRFARKHTQDEWNDIYQAGKFPAEAKKICPRLKPDKIKKTWWPHVYDFAHEYATGSGHVPSC